MSAAPVNIDVVLQKLSRLEEGSLEKSKLYSNFFEKVVTFLEATLIPRIRTLIQDKSRLEEELRNSANPAEIQSLKGKIAEYDQKIERADTIINSIYQNIQRFTTQQDIDKIDEIIRDYNALNSSNPRGGKKSKRRKSRMIKCRSRKQKGGARQMGGASQRGGFIALFEQKPPSPSGYLSAEKSKDKHRSKKHHHKKHDKKQALVFVKQPEKQQKKHRKSSSRKSSRKSSSSSSSSANNGPYF